MKKSFAFILIMCSLLSLLGCNKANDSGSTGSESEITDTSSEVTIEEDEGSRKAKEMILTAAEDVENVNYSVNSLIGKEEDDNGTYYTFLAYKCDDGSYYQVDIIVYIDKDGNGEIVSEITR